MLSGVLGPGSNWLSASKAYLQSFLMTPYFTDCQIDQKGSVNIFPQHWSNLENLTTFVRFTGLYGCTIYRFRSNIYLFTYTDLTKPHHLSRLFKHLSVNKPFVEMNSSVLWSRLQIMKRPKISNVAIFNLGDHQTNIFKLILVICLSAEIFKESRNPIKFPL